MVEERSRTRFWGKLALSALATVTFLTIAFQYVCPGTTCRLDLLLSATSPVLPSSPPVDEDLMLFPTPDPHYSIKFRFSPNDLDTKIHFDVKSDDVIVFLHIQKTGGTTFGRHLVKNIRLEVPCACKAGQKKCVCPRPGKKGTCLFSRFSTGWSCGLHADWTELVNCVPGMLDKKESVSRSRNYYYITMLRDPVWRYLSEWRHVQRGATWKSSLHMCDGRTPTPGELPPCYEGDDWAGVTLPEFVACPYNLANNRQEYLSASVEKLQGELARAREVESTVRQALSQKETDLHGVREEARRRKKLIATQQMLIQAGANHYHKVCPHPSPFLVLLKDVNDASTSACPSCPHFLIQTQFLPHPPTPDTSPYQCQHCDKAFVNYSYLQIHVTRRHPEVTNEERSRKMETQSLADQLAELKQELQATQTTLQAEREAQSELRAQERAEQLRVEEERRKELETWRETECERFAAEVRDVHASLEQELQQVIAHNATLEGKVQELSVPKSNLGMLRDDEEETKIKKKLWQIKKKEADMFDQMQEMQRIHDKEMQELQKELSSMRESMAGETGSMASLSRQMMRSQAQLTEHKSQIAARDDQIQKLGLRLQAQESALQMRSILKKEAKHSSKEERKHGSKEDKHSPKKEVKRLKLENIPVQPDLPAGPSLWPKPQDELANRLDSLGVHTTTFGISSTRLARLFSELAAQRAIRTSSRPELPMTRARIAARAEYRAVKGANNDKVLSRVRRGTRVSRYTPVTQSTGTGQNLKKKHASGVNFLTPHYEMAISTKQQSPIPTPRSQRGEAASQEPLERENMVHTPPFSDEESSSLYADADPASPYTHHRPDAVHSPKTLGAWAKLESSEESTDSLIQELTASVERKLSTSASVVTSTPSRPPRIPKPQPAKRPQVVDYELQTLLEELDEVDPTRGTA
uniref:Heparan-sulfate 6-O-sulfotransferase n=1 Tax=Eptatretus burgeri TaxID=7764 RepID=A0A8C4QLT0_EPTBU